jgi:hypothetical protein
MRQAVAGVENSVDGAFPVLIVEDDADLALVDLGLPDGDVVIPILPTYG